MPNPPTLYREPNPRGARLPWRIRNPTTPEENTMIRKSMIALAAVASLGAVALAPTSASAWGFHHHHGGFGWGLGWGFGPTYVDVAPDCYYVKKSDRFGNVRLVRVCG